MGPQSLRGLQDEGGSGDEDGEEAPVWVFILFFLFFSVGPLWHCITYPRRKMEKERQREEFDAAVASVQSKFEGEGASANADGGAAFEAYRADFDVRYVGHGTERCSCLCYESNLDCRVKHRSKLKMSITNSGGRYRIEGKGSDVDAAAITFEGYALRSGEAYWVEEIAKSRGCCHEREGVRGSRVLAEGKFDFDANEFEGTWRSDNGVAGEYISFAGKNVSRTAAAATATQMVEATTPTIAMMEMATPTAPSLAQMLEC